MLLFIKCILIGMFAIFPGVSGSALAISLNVYDEILLSLRNYKKNKIFFLTLILGMIIGVFIGSNILIYLTNIKNILYFIFIGLIISEIPFMIKKTNQKGKIRYYLLVLSFLFSLITLLFYKNANNNKVSPLKMFVGGFLFSFGKIFPGVSSSFFLIILGIYKKILLLFGNPTLLLVDFKYYMPFVLGIFLGLIIFIKLLSYLMIKKYDYLYSVLIGFIISSVITIFPKIEFRVSSIIGIVLMFLSFIISFKFNLKKEI